MSIVITTKYQCPDEIMGLNERQLLVIRRNYVRLVVKRKWAANGLKSVT